MAKRRHEHPRVVAAPRPATPFPGRRAGLAVALAAALALTYANSLSGAFVLDDQAAIVQNPHIRDLSRLRDLLVPAADSPIAGRPLASLTLALNHAAGGLDVRGYHVVNAGLHVACALFVLALVRRTVIRWNAAHAGRVDAPLVSFAAALLWGVHPLNSEVVNYLSQRTESLMALCYLAMLYAALRAAVPAAGLTPAAQDRGRHRTRWSVCAVAACLCGALAKESIVTAPVIVVLFDRVFLFASWRSQWLARRWLYAGLAGAWLLVGAVVAAGARAAVVGFSSGVSPWTYLLNQASVITTYLRLTVWPDALVAFYGWPQPMTVADSAPYLAFLLVLLAVTGLALWKWPPLGFLGAWFFITLAPASSIVPVSTEVGAERRMYLPLVAVAVLVALAIETMRRQAVRRAASPIAARFAGVGALVIILGGAGALAFVTADRNSEYRTSLGLTQTIVERRPTPVAHHMLAEELARAGRPDEAMSQLRLAIAGGNSRARYLLGQILAGRGQHDDALEQLEAFVRTYQPPRPLVPAWLEPPLTEVVPARFLLGRIYGARGEWDRSDEQARVILGLVPSHVGAHRLLADAAFARRQWADAIRHYGAYLARQPHDVESQINYGIAHVAVERLDDAVAAFRRATELDPSHARARELLALAEDDRARLAAAR